jgi:hypothetical protein
MFGTDLTIVGRRILQTLKKFLGPWTFALLLLSTPAIFAAQDSSQGSAKQDMKTAGQDTKDAAKKTGSATKQTAKKAGSAVKKGTNKVAGKTEDGAQKVKDKTDTPPSTPVN